jgi:hypothetical protein
MVIEADKISRSDVQRRRSVKQVHGTKGTLLRDFAT